MILNATRRAGCASDSHPSHLCSVSDGLNHGWKGGENRAVVDSPDAAELCTMKAWELLGQSPPALEGGAELAVGVSPTAPAC